MSLSDNQEGFFLDTIFLKTSLVEYLFLTLPGRFHCSGTILI